MHDVKICVRDDGTSCFSDEAYSPALVVHDDVTALALEESK